MILAAILGGLSMVAVFLLVPLVTELASRLARLSPRVQRKVNAWMRWWAKPLLGLPKGALPYLVAPALAVGVWTPLSYDPGAQPALSAEELGRSASLWLSEHARAGRSRMWRQGDPADPPFPRFAIPTGMAEIAGPRLGAGFDDGLPQMHELLRRMATGGAHPQMEDSPTLRRLRDGVVQDYALILDRPEAAARRDDKKAITGALIRQPQIFWAYRAPEEIRDQAWNGLWRQLSDLGFPPPEGRQDSLSPNGAH